MFLLKEFCQKFKSLFVSVEKQMKTSRYFIAVCSFMPVKGEYRNLQTYYPFDDSYFPEVMWNPYITSGNKRNSYKKINIHCQFTL